MERIKMEELVRWKEKPGRKPLILKGARQVGKTWLMKEFGERYFDQTAYVNLDTVSYTHLDVYKRQPLHSNSTAYPVSGLSCTSWKSEP